ncbi:MAG: arginase family protein [Pseudomonadota bacterium]
MTEDSRPRMGELFGGDSSGGFLGLEIVSPADIGSARADIVICGVPCATPYVSVGSYCADAPSAVRAAFGWPGVLDHHDFDADSTPVTGGVRAVDVGDLPYDERDFKANRAAISAFVNQVASVGGVPLVIGGDDSVPIPVLDGLAGHETFSIVQIDAHIDWRDEVAGERFGLSSNMRRASEMPWVTNIVQIGARGLGSARPSDYADACAYGVQFLPMRAIAADGMAHVIDALPSGGKVFVALDVDALDPSIVPAVIGPAPGGLTYWQTVQILEAVAARSEIVGFDLVELMPANDVGGRGALVANRLLARMLSLVSQQRAGRIGDTP